jgi:alcohol dehydrogenase class IV
MIFLPTRIYFGAGALVEAGDQLAQLGSRALIVCGKSSAHESGVMAELLPLLDKKEIKHSVYAGISENPSTDQVIRGKEQYIAESCDFIIGIGGGSPLDAAKAISLASANDLREDQLYDASLRQKAYPIVAIPTTHGTGSEVTQYSVLTDLSAKKKAGFGSDLIFPKIAIIDPRYTTSLNPKVSLNTSIDALSHLLEGIYSTQRNPLLYPMIFRGIKLIMDYLSLCLKEPEHLPAREALALASMYGGIAIAHTSTTLQHSIGYPFTTEFGVPHGLANGMFMEPIMRFYAPMLKDELAALFGFLDCSMQDFWDWLDEFPIKVKVPADDAVLNSWIPQILSARNTAISPVQPSERELLAILKTAQGDRT